MKAAIKRVQNGACSNYAEREQAHQEQWSIHINLG